jgi:hypothetical protein
VLYSGEQLDQKDLEVWLLLLKVFQGQESGYTLRIKKGHMLAALERPTHGGSRAALTSSLKRLASASVHVTYRNGKVEGIFHFLEALAWDNETQEICVQIGKGLTKLFDYTAFLHFETHLLLPSQMSKALHVYASGNICART